MFFKSKEFYNNQAASDYFEAGNQVWVAFGRSVGQPSHFKGWFTPMDSSFRYVVSGHPHSETCVTQLEDSRISALILDGYWVFYMSSSAWPAESWILFSWKEDSRAESSFHMPLVISTLHSGMDLCQALGGVLGSNSEQTDAPPIATELQVMRGPHPLASHCSRSEGHQSQLSLFYRWYNIY